MKCILFIHPEGNFNNNPNLFAIIELLIDNGYYIDILIKKNKIVNQKSYLNNLNIIFFKDEIDCDKKIDANKYSLLVGVDLGIIIASILSNKLNIPYFFISYEIRFLDEIEFESKKREIEACRNITFAVCQDPIRSLFLSRENNIPIEKIVNIPVSGRSKKNITKSEYLYESLNIPKDKKIVLFAGSISKWSMIEEIVLRSDTWSAEWVLVIHDRYGINSESLIDLVENRPHVFLSDKPLDTPHDLDKIICSADIGIGLYSTNFRSSYEGKNLAFMGLSSGKIISYLQYGVPIIMNEIGQLSDYVRENELGLVVSDVSEIDPDKITNIQLCKINCIRFFEDHLSFDRKTDQLLDLVINSIKFKKTDFAKISDFNNDNNSNYSISNLMQIEYYFNLAKEIESSKFYKLGYRLYNLNLIIKCKRFINRVISIKKIFCI